MSLASGVLSGVTSDDKWVTLDSDQVAYMTGASKAYYVLDSGASKVTYQASVTGESSVILGGITDITGLSAPVGNIIGLSSGVFGSGKAVSVLGNDGGYAFSISSTGTYNDLMFTGMSTADTIFNYGAGLKIYGLSGTDSITNAGANATIYGGDDNDTIVNSGATAMIFGGSGADSITNSGATATIDGGDDNDWISLLTGSNDASINVGVGNDTISVDNGTDKVTAFTVAGFTADSVSTV